MRRLIPLLIFLFILGSKLGAATATSPGPLPYGAVQPLWYRDWQTQRGYPFCTAFSINQAQGYWLTAGHCASGEIDQSDMRLEDEPVQVVKVSKRFDLALLRSAHEGALRRAAADVVEGQAVLAMGYPNGWTDISVVKGAVRYANVFVLNLFHSFMMTTLQTSHGHSGSPILNTQHEVVSIVSFGLKIQGEPQETEAGLPWEALVALTEEYWEPRSPVQ